MNKLVFRVTELVVKKCTISMLTGEMDISNLMDHAQQIEKQNIKHKQRENMKARIGNID